MLRYNRARRAEWLETQKQFEADELAAARLAYIKGEATTEQALLVEEANAEAEAAGVKLPPLLAPAQHRTHFEEHVKPALESEGKGKGVLGLFSGIWGGSGKAEETQQESGVVKSVEANAGYVQEKAKGAWAQEKENQRRGGSLDQVGLEATPASGKKGWWPW